MMFYGLTPITGCFHTETQRACPGITFFLPSRRRFIPYSWLLHADLNQKHTELQLHYTHMLVTITGLELGRLYEAVSKLQLYIVLESFSSGTVSGKDPSVSRIEISEKISDAP